MKEQTWIRWIVQTARTWDDISEVVIKTGIERIDHDHQVLVEHALELNRLIQAFERDDLDLETIEQESKLFEKLYTVVESHFNWEVRFIERLKLKGLGRQKDQHAKFLAMLRAFMDDFKNGRLWVSLNLKMSVLEWVVDHINQVDHDTFCISDWMPQVVEEAESWADVRELVQNTSLFRIDDEHKDLIVLTLSLNQQIKAWDRGDLTALGNADGAALIERIGKYASLHFDREQRFISENAIPGLERQVEAHGTFLNMLKEFATRAGSGEHLDPRKTKVAIMIWWIEHINQIDRETFMPEQWVARFLESSDSWDRFVEIIKMTGVTWIDDEHRQLIHLSLDLNAIIDRLETEEGSAELVEKGLAKLEGLIRFSEGHFDREVTFIAKHQIPGQERQEKAHAYFLSTMRTLHEDIRKNRIVFSARIKAQIISWWNDHINYTDFNTFRLENWAGRLFSEARSFADLELVIKQVGVDWIDREHRELVEQTLTLLRFLDPTDDGPDRGGDVDHDRTASQLREIHNFSARHFAQEEKMMAAHNLPGMEPHQDKHRMFLDGMRQYMKSPEQLPGAGMEGFRNWIFRWWINHINEVDCLTFKAVAQVEPPGDQSMQLVEPGAT